VVYAFNSYAINWSHLYDILNILYISKKNSAD